jgi:hypothetical protein
MYVKVVKTTKTNKIENILQILELSVHIARLMYRTLGFSAYKEKSIGLILTSPRSLSTDKHNEQRERRTSYTTEPWSPGEVMSRRTFETGEAMETSGDLFGTKETLQDTDEENVRTS